MSQLPGLNFQLGEDIDALRDAVREFAQTEIAPRAAEIDRSDQFPMDLWRKFGELGVLGIDPDERAIAFARQAAADGAQVICFQELFYGPYFGITEDAKYYDFAEPADGPVVQRFAALAAELRTQLAAATGRAAALAEQQAGHEARAQEQAHQLGQQAEQIEQLKRDLATARKPKPQPAPLTRWQHLRAALLP